MMFMVAMASLATVAAMQSDEIASVAQLTDRNFRVLGHSNADCDVLLIGASPDFAGW